METALETRELGVGLRPECLPGLIVRDTGGLASGQGHDRLIEPAAGGLEAVFDALARNVRPRDSVLLEVQRQIEPSQLEVRAGEVAFTCATTADFEEELAYLSRYLRPAKKD